MTDQDLTRRETLKLAGGVPALGAAGLAAGEPGDTVRVNIGYTGARGAANARRAAAAVIYEFAFDALTVRLSRSAARDLAGMPGIRYVELDAPVYALDQTLPWGIDRVDAEVAQAKDSEQDEGTKPETGGDDVETPADVAIIDTGIDATHPDLVGNLGEGKSFVGSTVTGTGTPAWQDDNGHGTHVAGIADAVNNTEGVVGVSTEATLHAVKVLSAAGAGLTSDVAKGIEYVAGQNWDVGNLSLGGPDSDTLQGACEQASEKGVLLPAAAGNSGSCEDCVTFPAAYQECIAVSATTRGDDLADFSSTGKEVELAAPGDAIYSTYLGGVYATLSGTSMAAPHVSGAGGQLMVNGFDNDEARAKLTKVAESTGLTSRESGAGLLDVAAALEMDSSDNLSGSSSDDSTSPSVAIESVSENESPNPHAEFDVSWSVHDDGRNLDSVTLQLRDATDGEFEDSATNDVSGSDASGTTRLRAHKEDRSGHEYEITVHARDEAGNTDKATTTVAENGR